MVQSPPRTNPFPGLRTFELDEEHLFFGREGQADELLTRLNRTRFLAVVGTSGSGKSSLVRAGLLPSLYSGLMQKASSGWRVAILRPGSAPMANLAAALNDPEVFGVDPASDDAIIRTALTESTLRRGPLGLVEVAQQARMEPYENLLVVVDQFEELFRFKAQAQGQDRRLEAEDEAAAFVKLLLGAVGQRDVPIFVVLTMRSDFLGDCAQFRDLPETLNDSQYLIPRLTREQLRSAIEGPVAVGGATITPRLVNRLLNDTGDNPDQLPILQHALMRTWIYWEANHKPREPIDLEHYLAIGGMEHALSRHAQQIYAELPNERSRTIAQTLFKCLTDRGLDNRGVRRPCKINEIYAVSGASFEEVADVIEYFRAPGCSFLMPPKNIALSSETVIDISHESLMRNWEDLQDWIEDEADSAKRYRRLVESATLYSNGQTGPLRDPELSDAWKWLESEKLNEAWANRYSLQWNTVLQFLANSNLELEDEKKGSQTYIRLAESAVLYEEGQVGLLQEPELSVALKWREEFQPNKDWAERHAPNFDQAMSYLEASLSAREEKVLSEEQERRRAIRNLRRYLGIVLGLLILALGTGAFAFTQIAVTRAALIATQQAQGQERKAREQAEEARQLAEMALSQARDAQNEERTQRSFAERRRQEAEAARQAADLERQRALDAKNLAEQAQNAEAEQRRIAVQALKRAEVGEAEARLQAQIAEQQTQLAEQQFIFAEHARRQAEITALNSNLIAMAASSDALYFSGKKLDAQLTALEAANYVQTVPHNIQHSTRIQVAAALRQATESKIVFPTENTTAFSYSPDAQTIATGDRDGNIIFWDNTGQKLQEFGSHNGRVWSVTFSPDGQTLATANADRTVKIWDFSGHLLMTLQGHTDRVLSTAISPDGQELATASADGTVKIWLFSGEEIVTLEHQDAVLGVNFSPDGTTLISVSADGSIYLWSRDGDLQRKLSSEIGSINSAVFSPDGQTIVAASANGAINIWSITGELLRTLQRDAEGVYGLAINPSGEVLATAGGSGVVELLSLEGNLIGSLRGHQEGVYAVGFSPAGTSIGSLDNSGEFILWDMNLDSLIANACNQLRDYMANPTTPPEEKSLCEGYIPPALLQSAAPGPLHWVANVRAFLGTALARP
jgi:hypothetical protein